MHRELIAAALASTAVLMAGAGAAAPKRPAPAKSAPYVDLRAVAAATDLTYSGGTIINSCGEPIKGVERKDLNGDGRPEVILGDAGVCSGNAGYFTVLTRDVSGKWKVVLETEGIYFIKPQKTKGWSNIEVGLPGMGPQPGIYKWNGTKYVQSDERAGSDVGADQPPAVAQASLPAAVEYVGAIGSDRFPMQVRMQVTNAGGSLGGSSYMRMGMLDGMAPLTGTYSQGECTIQRKRQTFRGPCDANEFSGTIYDGKGKPDGRFLFRSTSASAPAQASAGEGYAPAYAARGPVPTAVWALGRARVLAERSGRCASDDRLGKSYCFDGAKAWLQRRPSKRDLDVIAMDEPYAIGSLIPYNNGIGWNVYNVTRDGETFSAKKQLHFTTKIPMPQGCMYQGVLQKAWYISIARGRRVAVEAQQYACAGWVGEPLYTRAIDYAYVDADQLEYAALPGSAGNAPVYNRGGTPRQDEDVDFAFRPGVLQTPSPLTAPSVALSRAASRAEGTRAAGSSNCAINEIQQAHLLALTGRSRPICQPAAPRGKKKR